MNEATVTFFVVGTPMPKAMTARAANGHVFNARRPASQKKFNEWARALRVDAGLAMKYGNLIGGPVAVTVEFFLAPPKHETKAMAARIWHTARFDVDKLARTVFDCLTGTVIVDDGQIAIARLEKRFARDDMPTGARISITSLPDGE